MFTINFLKKIRFVDIGLTKCIELFSIEYREQTVWEKLHHFVQVAIGFGFPSHWLISWLEIIKPITKHSKLLHNMAIIAIA